MFFLGSFLELLPFALSPLALVFCATRRRQLHRGIAHRAPLLAYAHLLSAIRTRALTPLPLAVTLRVHDKREIFGEGPTPNCATTDACVRVRRREILWFRIVVTVDLTAKICSVGG